MGALTTALLLGIAMATLGLATAVFAQAFIDTLIPSGDKVRIYASIALLIGILLTRLALAYRRQHLMLRQGFSINNRIVGSFLSNLMLLPKPFFDSRHTGDMVARLNDVGRIQQTVSFVFGELLINALMAVAALVAIWAYSSTIGLVLLGCTPLYAAVAVRHHGRIMRQQQGVMSAYALNQSNYISTMHNIEPIKALGREVLFARTAMQIFRDLQGKMLNLGQLGVLVQIRAELVGLLAIALVVLLSAHQMLSGDMTAGTFMAVFSLSGTLLPAVAGIAFANVQIQGARVAFERMYEFASMEKETTQTTETSVPIEFEELKIENVDFRYAGRRQLLNGLSLSVQRGQMVALWGDNGSGKSTIMGLLQRFYTPEGGRISLNGTDIGQLPLQHYRALLGVVPQHVGLLNAPLLANIVMDDRPEAAERRCASSANWAWASISNAFRRATSPCWARAVCPYRAGSGSWWGLPVRWCANPNCCSSMSQPPISTALPRRLCYGYCSRSASAWASCASRTAPRWPPTPTALRCYPTAKSPPKARTSS